MGGHMLKRLITWLFLSVIISGINAKEYGVYQFVLTRVQGDIATITAQLKNNAVTAGFTVLADYDIGVPEDCTYKGHLILLNDSSYTEQMMRANAQTAPYAIVDRINIFQDEDGTHIAVVNPHSINRTMLMDDQQYETLSEAHLKKIRTLIMQSTQGTPSRKEYGQFRDAGFISKTMGVMAGGKFAEKIEDLFIKKNASWRTIATQVMQALRTPGPEWGMHAVFKLELAGYNTAVIGVTGRAMEAKSFDIVGAGDDDDRDDFDCPGIADAGAYPFSLVIKQAGNDVKIQMVTSMYRMKIFFEDAGKWAFMKNMTMPGSLTDEMHAMIKKGLLKLPE